MNEACVQHVVILSEVLQEPIKKVLAVPLSPWLQLVQRVVDLK